MEPTSHLSINENPIRRIGTPEVESYIETLLPPESILQENWYRPSRCRKITVKDEYLTPPTSGMKREFSAVSNSPVQRQRNSVESTSWSFDHPVKQKLESPGSRDLDGFIKDETPDADDADDYGSPGPSNESWVKDNPSGNEDEDEDRDENDDSSLFVPEMPNAHSSHDGDSAAAKNVEKKTSTRPKTAREYRKLYSLKSKFGLAWKEDTVAKIVVQMQKGKEKAMAGLQPKTPKQNCKFQKAAGVVNLKSLMSAGVSASEVDIDADPGPILDISVSQKGKFLNELLAKYPHLDLHKCKGEYNDLIKKSRTFGYGHVKKDGNGWRLQSMKTSLHNHQLIGTAWMLERECLEEGPHGGILADEVGVGKTLQAIAVVVGNPAPTEQISKGIKASLFVVPYRLLYQWKDEFIAHSNLRPWIYKHADENNEIERVRNNDVVLTTYHELKASLPFPNKATIGSWKENKIDVEQAIKSYIQDNMEDAGILHRITWYRIVLDEAHMIKKHLRFARAAIALKGENRWALTATPIMNCCEELYPLFNFIQDPFITSYNFAQFSNLFCKANDSLSRNALEVALSDIIIRRQKHDKIFKAALVPLLPSHKGDVEVYMSPPERLLYRAFQDNLRALLNQAVLENDPRKKLRWFRPQLTSLRQMVSNPDIIERQLKTILSFEEFSDLQVKLSKLRLSTKSDITTRRILHQRINTWIKEKRESASDPSSAPKDRSVCMMCNDDDDDLVYLTRCGHVFCKSCIEENFEKDAEDDDEEVQLCSLCRTSFNCNQRKPLNPPAKDFSRRSVNSPKRAKDVRGFRPSLLPSQAEWLRKLDEEGLEVFPSAKLAKTMEILRKWRRDAPSEKVVLFAQWKPLIIMTGLKLQQQNQLFVYFTGDMTLKQQGEAISKFRGSPQINVMVASLKAGGTGLNLQFANRMIIMDLWWNTAAEAQALGRIERWGQTRETYFKKLIATNSVDTRILDVQRRKDKMIASLMKDNLEKLSIGDMATLLGGKIITDEHGKPSIVYDEDDEDDASGLDEE